ncbi:unnamed protein product [Prorocentrum cordatum]|uniref:ATP-dependent DNA helicase n=1 Tax=Prorocentrum cordatum TaxID=2364126 RepID=A0ABN9XP84_9DINO|nr:unnamed protein product [Polarella glacialis]
MFLLREIAHFGITEPEADLRWEAQLAEVGVWEAAVAKAAAQRDRELARQERDESRARMAQHREHTRREAEALMATPPRRRVQGTAASPAAASPPSASSPIASAPPAPPPMNAPPASADAPQQTTPGVDTRPSVREHQRSCFIHGHRMIYSITVARPHCFTFRCPRADCTQIFQMRRDRAMASGPLRRALAAATSGASARTVFLFFVRAGQEVPVALADATGQVSLHEKKPGSYRQPPRAQSQHRSLAERWQTDARARSRWDSKRWAGCDGDKVRGVERELQPAAEQVEILQERVATAETRLQRALDDLAAAQKEARDYKRKADAWEIFYHGGVHPVDGALWSGRKEILQQAQIQVLEANQEARRRRRVAEALHEKNAQLQQELNDARMKAKGKGKGEKTDGEPAAGKTRLQTHQITPDPQQMSILNAVADRCVQEASEQDQPRGSPCSRLFVLGLPGSGKSEVIRRLCDEEVGLFPTCMGWEHEVHFMKTAPMNSMASNIGGRTIHNFSKLGIDLITGVQSGGKKDPELSENLLHTKIQHMRWLIIDEVENVYVELLDAVHRQVQDSTRDRGNPWAVDARVPKQFAMFGGLNLVLLGDLWQIPPVRSLSIAANPFVKRPANVGRVLEMFWTEGLPHSATHRYALSQSHRCSDPWWRSFLAEARAGDLSDRMYDFVHVFPTDVHGSWMPASPGSAEASTGHLGCGKAKCRTLWSVEWPRMFGEGRPWEDMKSLECADCSAERRRRCRVASQSDARQREVRTAFADALFVHPYNAPNAAANAGKQLLWVVARDVPLTRGDACRSKESLAHARQNWLMYPENKTGGVPGVLPIFQGMRARFTTTENAEAGACKHSWGTVTGWALHPDDSKLVKEHRSEPELVLQHVPEAIMVQIPGNTSPRFGNQPAGVFPVKVKEVSWDRSPGFKAMVKRVGFPLVPHFAATARCVTGATLPQAIIDLLDARTTPRSSMVPTGYVAISRTRRADDLIITQPFSPMLFRQGRQTGPWLLHSMTAGELTMEQAKAGWAKAEKEAASKSSKKLVDATFQCGDCHKRKRAGNFPGSGIKTSDPVEHAVAVLGQGAWRRCALCAQKPAPASGAAGAASAAAAPLSWKGTDALVCNRCKEPKPLKNFRRSEVNDLTGRGELDLAVCVACTPERQHFNVLSEGRLFKCRICLRDKALTLRADGLGGDGAFLGSVDFDDDADLRDAEKGQGAAYPPAQSADSEQKALSMDPENIRRRMRQEEKRLSVAGDQGGTRQTRAGGTWKAFLALRLKGERMHPLSSDFDSVGEAHAAAMRDPVERERLIAKGKATRLKARFSSRGAANARVQKRRCRSLALRPDPALDIALQTPDKIEAFRAANQRRWADAAEAHKRDQIEQQMLAQYQADITGNALASTFSDFGSFVQGGVAVKAESAQRDCMFVEWQPPAAEMTIHALPKLSHRAREVLLDQWSSIHEMLRRVDMPKIPKPKKSSVNFGNWHMTLLDLELVDEPLDDFCIAQESTAQLIAPLTLREAVERARAARRQLGQALAQAPSGAPRAAAGATRQPESSDDHAPSPSPPPEPNRYLFRRLSDPDAAEAAPQFLAPPRHPFLKWWTEPLLNAVARRMETLRYHRDMTMESICFGLGTEVMCARALGLPIKCLSMCDLKSHYRSFLKRNFGNPAAPAVRIWESMADAAGQSGHCDNLDAEYQPIQETIAALLQRPCYFRGEAKPGDDFEKKNIAEYLGAVFGWEDRDTTRTAVSYSAGISACEKGGRRGLQATPGARMAPARRGSGAQLPSAGPKTPAEDLRLLLDHSLSGEVSVGDSTWSLSDGTLVIELAKKVDYSQAAGAPASKPRPPWWPCAVRGGRRGPDDPKAPAKPESTLRRLEVKVGEQAESRGSFSGKSKFQW